MKSDRFMRKRVAFTVLLVFNKTFEAVLRKFGVRLPSLFAARGSYPLLLLVTLLDPPTNMFSPPTPLPLLFLMQVERDPDV